MNGDSQVIRLPKGFHIEGNEVYIAKKEDTLLITEKNKREGFKTALDEIFGCCPDFD